MDAQLEKLLSTPREGRVALGMHPYFGERTRAMKQLLNIIAVFVVAYLTDLNVFDSYGPF